MSKKRVQLSSILMEYPQARFFIDALPIHKDGMIAYTSSFDEAKVVEAKIIEDRYKVGNGYKLTLKPIDKKYATSDYYQMDFISLCREYPNLYYVTVDGEGVKLV